MGFARLFRPRLACATPNFLYAALVNIRLCGFH
jgi:hypothetical protein